MSYSSPNCHLFDAKKSICLGFSEPSLGCAPQINIPTTQKLLSKKCFGQRKELIEKIKYAINKSDVAFVIGAGVSIPAGLPNWCGLVSKMMGYSLQYHLLKGTLDVPKKDKLRTLQLTESMINGSLCFLNNVDTLESGEYIAQYFGDSSAPEQKQRELSELSMRAMLERMLHNVKEPIQLINESKDPKIQQVCKKIKEIGNTEYHPLSDFVKENLTGQINLDQFEQSVAKQSTIAAVAYVLSKSKIKKALTYNYDPLVELYMHCLYGSRYTVYTGEEKKPKYSLHNSTCDIFHVHGFVPGQYQKKLNNIPQPTNNLIFSEDSYYDEEKNGLYKFSSRIQANFFNEKNCLFVGFSATDYNFKRILRQIGRYPQIPVNHYLIFTIDDIVKATFQDVCRYHMRTTGSGIDMEVIQRDTKLLLKQILIRKQKYWERFQINPIWITIPEIAKFLVDLCK